MAAALYPAARTLFLSGGIDLLNDTIKCVLVKSAYTYSAAHDYLNDLGSNTVGTAQTLANPDATDGVFDADNATFSAVTTGSTCDRLLIYKHVSSSSDSPVIALLDLAAAVATDGGDVTVVFDDGGIFSFVQ